MRRSGIWIGGAILTLVALAGLLAPWIAPHDPYAQDLTRRLAVPFWMEGALPEHLLGTDQLGRDYLSRLIFGARVSLIIGAMVASAIVGVNSPTGMLVAAGLGGLLGSVVMVFAWFVGVSLLGAGIGVLLAHLVWTQIASGDPPVMAIIAVAVAAQLLQLGD
jgi:peptide/nickel transport system permease protein